LSKAIATIEGHGVKPVPNSVFANLLFHCSIPSELIRAALRVSATASTDICFYSIVLSSIRHFL
jgi:hypothetical protein